MKLTAVFMLAATAAALGAHAQAPATAPSATPPTEFVEGTHYQRLPSPQPTSTDSNKVEVAEIFMFGCPGCYAFEPQLQKWLSTKPAYVNFVRVPAMWEPWAPLHARAYYTAEALGKLKDIEGAFFNEFHAKGNKLDTEAKIGAFFQLYGVDATTFKNTFNSFFSPETTLR